MRPPADANIFAPEFPPRMQWVGAPFMRMDRLMGSHAVLIEFWDFARIHSLRTMPYLRAWQRRYGDMGLTVIGVHSPGYSFGRDPETVERAIERLEVPYPVLLDADLEVWRLYGNRGWPGRYLFDRRSLLRHLHYGEGEYAETELAIQECLRELDEDLEMPAVMEPLRAEDAPGVLLSPQTADIALPADRERLELVRDWTDGPDWIEAAHAGSAATFTFSAGEAHAVMSGGGLEPGIYETGGTVTAEEPGLRLHGVQFTPAPPVPA